MTQLFLKVFVLQNLQQEQIPKLLQAIHQTAEDPESANTQQNLITASNDFVPVKILRFTNTIHLETNS